VLVNTGVMARTAKADLLPALPGLGPLLRQLNKSEPICTGVRLGSYPTSRAIFERSQHFVDPIPEHAQAIAWPWGGIGAAV